MEPELFVRRTDESLFGFQHRRQAGRQQLVRRFAGIVLRETEIAPEMAGF
jgi:hypothetical protein